MSKFYKESFILDLDIIEVALKALKDRSLASACNRGFLVSDALGVSGLRDSLFDAIIEKGTLDSLMSDVISGQGQGLALLMEIRRLLAPCGICLLVSHNPSRDSLVLQARLQIKAVHKCYLSDITLIINSLRVAHNGSLAEAVSTESGLEALKEAKERIAKKHKTLLLKKMFRRFKPNIDERHILKSDRKQDFCWIYILTR